MITIQSNASVVLTSIIGKIRKIQNTDQVMRAVATNARAAMKRRIHIDGKDSEGKAIGKYSDAYMKLRTGNYSNAKRKTKKKDAGQFTKGKNVGKPRPKYNRGSDTKVIASLTREMENDMVVVASQKGYGIGYLNAENFKKVGFLEHTYKKGIFQLTPDEKKQSIDTVKTEVQKILNAKS